MLWVQRVQPLRQDGQAPQGAEPPAVPGMQGGGGKRRSGLPALRRAPSAHRAAGRHAAQAKRGEFIEPTTVGMPAGLAQGQRQPSCAVK